MTLILGSGSPRRKEILEFFSVPFKQITSDYDEEALVFNGDPKAYAKDIAKGKAESLAKLYPSDIILTADTVVYCDGKLFLKPKTMQQAHQMLRDLSGKKHQVYTGVCVFGGNKEFIDVEESSVEFCELTDSEIVKYADAFAPLDKAGGYAIQKGGSLIVKRIEGCYYNIMGLPLQKVRRLLLNVGIDLWDYFKSV
jgi:septum formation protein